MDATSTYDTRNAGGLQKGNTILGAQPTTLENPSCFGALMTATSEVAALRSRIESLVARLCGAVPEQGSGEAVDPIPGAGLLPIADRRCRDVLKDVNAAHAELDRLEKNLP